jgi:hypothetical protein
MKRLSLIVAMSLAFAAGWASGQGGSQVLDCREPASP